MNIRHKKRISLNDYTELITGKVKEVMSQDRFKHFLLSPGMLLSFRKEVLGLEPYSFNNRLTLALFGARAVAGYQTWKSLGYQVKKGSKGIPIYRPLLVKKSEEELDQVKPGSSEQKTLIGFDVAYVFDISQVAETDGEYDLSGQKKVKSFMAQRETRRNFCLELKGGDTYLAGKITSWIDNQFPVEFQRLLDGSKGFTNGEKIVIKEGMSPAQTMKTLLHEVSHIRLNHHELSMGQDTKEIQAEAAAFVSAHKLGLDTGTYSFDYLASWGNDLLKAVDGLVKFKDTIKGAITEGDAMAGEIAEYMNSFLPIPVRQQTV